MIFDDSLLTEGYDLAEDAFQYLSPMIDLRTWSPRKAHRLKSKTLARLLSYFPAKLLLAPEALSAGKAYIQGSSSGPVTLMGLDVDAHHGETDAKAVAEWLRDAYFPGVYLEPATNGYHLYVKLDMNGQTVARLREVANGLNRVMDLARKAIAHCATVDGLKGLPMDASNVAGRWVILNRGTLIRAPILPDGQASLEGLRESPVFAIARLEALRTILEAAHSEGESLTIPLSESVTTGPKALPRVIHTNELITESSPPKVYIVCSHGPGMGTPAQRMNRAYTLWARQQGAPCDDPEALVDFYGALGFATGPRTPDRLKVAANVIAWRAQFQHRTWYDPLEYIPAIVAHVTPAIRNDPRIWGRGKPPAYCVNIPDDSLSAMVSVVTLNTLEQTTETRELNEGRPSLRFSTADSQIAAFLKRAHEGGLISSPLGRKAVRIAAMRLLELSGLIYKRANYSSPNKYRAGFGTRWALGPNHPRRPEFVALCAKHGLDPDTRILP